jgi:flagellar basal-body rod modification protein FlgD
MKNQDPLNPLDNAQVTSQMAQINTVSGVNTLNTSVTQLLAQFQHLEAMQAAQLSGRNVLVAGKTLSVPAEGADTAAGNLKGGFELASAADRVSVVVKNAAGSVVRTITMSQSDGSTMQSFTWDGKDDDGNAVAAGDYAFAVQASANGTEVPASATYAARRVTGVTTTSDGVSLLLSGGSTVAYADVKQIL